MWNLLKSFNSRAFWLEFWEERGERINDLSPLSWQFFWNFMTFVLLSKVESFETDFSFEKTPILNLMSWNICLFWILSFTEDVFNCRKLIVFSCLQFADYYIWPRILSCGVIFVRFITVTKIFTLKSFLLRRHYHGVVENMCSFSKSYL